MSNTGKKFNLTELLNQRSKEVAEPVKQGQQTEEVTTIKDIISTAYIYDLVPSKDNFYSVEDVGDLKQSIELLGVLQPLLVTEEEEDGTHRIIAGHRRYIALKQLVSEGKEKFRKVPILVISTQNVILDRLALIMTNRFREKTDWEKMTEALETEELVLKLKETTNIRGKTRDLLAEILKKSPAQIGRYKAIYNNLIPELMSEFKSDKIVVSVIYEVSGMTKEYQQRAAELFEENDYYHLGDEGSFDFDIREARKVGADFRNDLCNGMMQFYPDYFKDERKFCRALFIKKYPSSLSDRFLNEITSLPVHSITSIDVVPIPKDMTTKILQKKYFGIESDIIKQQRVRNKNNDFSSEISYNKRIEKKEIEEIMDDVRENDQCLYYVAVTIILMADSKEELDSMTETVETIGKRNSVTIEEHYLKQREALNTALPIGVRQVETMRTMLTQSLAVLMPFNVQELNDGSGCYYGINQVSKNINIGNRKKLINGNGFVFGVPGSGKSFFCKMEMGNVFLGTEDEIIVIDPMNEYFDIAYTYGGTVVNMSTYTDNYVNPLDMDVWSLDLNDSKGMIREKGEFMLGLCEQCMGESLNSRQKSIIDRCVRKLYIDIARSREKFIPVMSDFYEILMNQPEEEAKDIALSLELFVNGSLNIFNHQTNVDVDNRFTVYGIRDLGTELSPITMLVMMESIQNRIIANGKRGVATWLYIDEFHVLLNSEYSAKYLQQLWKKVRKQGGLCTGITQNVVDLLQNYTATTMLANSEFVALLKQANTDSSKMAEVIGVSEAQLRFVTNTQSGMGLMKCGNVVIPFDNQIEKGTDLYNLYNTNIHEKIALEKSKNAS